MILFEFTSKILVAEVFSFIILPVDLPYCANASKVAPKKSIDYWSNFLRSSIEILHQERANKVFFSDFFFEKILHAGDKINVNSKITIETDNNSLLRLTGVV